MPVLSSLHTQFILSEATERLLAQWDTAIRDDVPVRLREWHFLLLDHALRSTTVAASTAIEGNQLSVRQVGQVLAGGTVDGRPVDIREALNYDEAMTLVNRMALRHGFEWSEEAFHSINRTVMRGLPDDTFGEYRGFPVRVGEAFDPPESVVVPALMEEFVGWLRHCCDHPLVRVALIHLNLVAIHPFGNGNGRTARLACALDLMRSGVGSPELVSVEAYLREHQDDYFRILAQTLGPRYDPENHAATPWLEYYTDLSITRLNWSARISEAARQDLGTYAARLGESGEPLDWAPVLILASMRPIRTRDLASISQRSGSRTRVDLGRMARARWLAPEGETRARRYHPGPKLLELRLRLPELAELAQPMEGQGTAGNGWQIGLWPGVRATTSTGV